jgi:hypothetical protein
MSKVINHIALKSALTTKGWTQVQLAEKVDFYMNNKERI